MANVNPAWLRKAALDVASSDRGRILIERVYGNPHQADQSDIGISVLAGCSTWGDLEDTWNFILDTTGPCPLSLEPRLRAHFTTCEECRKKALGGMWQAYFLEYAHTYGRLPEQGSISANTLSGGEQMHDLVLPAPQAALVEVQPLAKRLAASQPLVHRTDSALTLPRKVALPSIPMEDIRAIPSWLRLMVVGNKLVAQLMCNYDHRHSWNKPGYLIAAPCVLTEAKLDGEASKLIAQLRDFLAQHARTEEIDYLIQQAVNEILCPWLEQGVRIIPRDVQPLPVTIRYGDTRIPRTTDSPQRYVPGSDDPIPVVDVASEFVVRLMLLDGKIIMQLVGRGIVQELELPSDKKARDMLYDTLLKLFAEHCTSPDFMRTFIRGIYEALNMWGGQGKIPKNYLEHLVWDR